MWHWEVRMQYCKQYTVINSVKPDTDSGEKNVFTLSLSLSLSEYVFARMGKLCVNESIIIFITIYICGRAVHCWD